jgi:hypothetical protein
LSVGLPIAYFSEEQAIKGNIAGDSFTVTLIGDTAMGDQRPLMEENGLRRISSFCGMLPFNQRRTAW